MQMRAGIRAEANDITGIRWNLWTVEDDIKHARQF